MSYSKCLKKMSFKSARLDPQIKIWDPIEIKEHIERSAENNERLKVAEIPIRLVKSFKQSSKEE